MSRSNPTLVNPAQHFFEWQGSKGQLTWYNKEKKENVQVKIPFEFMVLDELATITGFSKRDDSRYWSNEVRSVAKEEFTVKTARGVAQIGLYKELADVRAKGAKYAKSIYLAHKIGDEWVIGNFKASGSSLSAWIEFSGTCIPQNGKAILTGSTHVPAANGISEYYIPTFEYKSINKEEYDVAIELDKQLQIFLNQYLAAAQFDRASQPDSDVDQSVGMATPEQLADYEERKKAKLDTSPDPMAAVHASDPMTPDVIIEDIGEEPINLDDIPF